MLARNTTRRCTFENNPERDSLDSETSHTEVEPHSRQKIKGFSILEERRSGRYSTTLKRTGAVLKHLSKLKMKPVPEADIMVKTTIRPVLLDVLDTPTSVMTYLRCPITTALMSAGPGVLTMASFIICTSVCGVTMSYKMLHTPTYTAAYQSQPTESIFCTLNSPFKSDFCNTSATRVNGYFLTSTEMLRNFSTIFQSDDAFDLSINLSDAEARIGFFARAIEDYELAPNSSLHRHLTELEADSADAINDWMTFQQRVHTCKEQLVQNVNRTAIHLQAAYNERHVWGSILHALRDCISTILGLRRERPVDMYVAGLSHHQQSLQTLIPLASDTNSRLNGIGPSINVIYHEVGGEIVRYGFAARERKAHSRDLLMQVEQARGLRGLFRVLYTYDGLRAEAMKYLQATMVELQTTQADIETSISALESFQTKLLPKGELCQLVLALFKTIDELS